MLLSKNLEEFERIIELVSRDTGVAKTYVEKDYYAISILKELIKRNNDFVFKGGTSLSVCQKVINRFSEDIDISYAYETITVGQRKKIKTAFFESIEATSLSVSNAENIRSRRVFNRYLCPYTSLFSHQEDRVIVEWATQTPAFPIEEKEAQTIIGRYLSSIGRDDLIKKYELESFIVKTITKERTFVDKVFAICDYHISKILDRQSRHIYDIHQLLPLIKLDQSIIDLFNKVREYREKLETCYSVLGDKKISDYLFELVKEDTYKQDYNSKTYPLLYDGVKYGDCLKSIEKVMIFLKDNNL